MRSFSHPSAAMLILTAMLLPVAGADAQNRESAEDRFVQRTDGTYVYRVRRGYDPLVAQVQSILVQKDIYHHRHHNQVDGIFGEETRHAVEDFQRFAGLPASGMLDSGTLQALGLIEGSGSEGDATQGAPARSEPATAPAPARTQDPNEVLTPMEVADLLKVSENDVIELINSNKLAAKKIGPNWRILRGAVDTFFRSVDPVEDEVEESSAEPQQQRDPKDSKDDHDHDHVPAAAKKHDHKH